MTHGWVNDAKKYFYGWTITLNIQQCCSFETKLEILLLSPSQKQIKLNELNKWKEQINYHAQMNIKG